METQFIKLNMIPSGVNPCFHISQYDIGRSLGFMIYNGSEVVNLDSYNCTIEATRTDGVAITASVATDDNVGTFETTATMTNKADKYKAQFVIVDGDSNRIASLPFDMDVCKAAMDENAESIEEDASLYQQYTEAVQGAIAEANADIQAEENARIAAVSAEENARIAAVNAEENARIAAVNAEATTRANADATLQNNIDAEATARQTADNTLQGNINAEASTRATQDASLQSQINQIIAPSGEAPSAAEVQNARIGADGVTYSTLGDAIRTNDSGLKNAISGIQKRTDLFYISPTGTINEMLACSNILDIKVEGPLDEEIKITGILNTTTNPYSVYVGRPTGNLYGGTIDSTTGYNIITLPNKTIIKVLVNWNNHTVNINNTYAQSHVYLIGDIINQKITALYKGAWIRLFKNIEAYPGSRATIKFGNTPGVYKFGVANGIYMSLLLYNDSAYSSLYINTAWLQNDYEITLDGTKYLKIVYTRGENKDQNVVTSDYSSIFIHKLIGEDEYSEINNNIYTKIPITLGTGTTRTIVKCGAISGKYVFAAFDDCWRGVTLYNDASYSSVYSDSGWGVGKLEMELDGTKYVKVFFAKGDSKSTNFVSGDESKLLIAGLSKDVLNQKTVETNEFLKRMHSEMIFDRNIGSTRCYVRVGKEINSYIVNATDDMWLSVGWYSDDYDTLVKYTEWIKGTYSFETDGTLNARINFAKGSSKDQTITTSDIEDYSILSFKKQYSVEDSMAEPPIIYPPVTSSRLMTKIFNSVKIGQEIQNKILDFKQPGDMCANGIGKFDIANGYMYLAQSTHDGPDTKEDVYYHCYIRLFKIDMSDMTIKNMVILAEKGGSYLFSDGNTYTYSNDADIASPYYGIVTCKDGYVYVNHSAPFTDTARIVRIKVDPSDLSVIQRDICSCTGPVDYCSNGDPKYIIGIAHQGFVERNGSYYAGVSKGFKTVGVIKTDDFINFESFYEFPVNNRFTPFEEIGLAFDTYNEQEYMYLAIRTQYNERAFVYLYKILIKGMTVVEAAKIEDSHTQPSLFWYGDWLMLHSGTNDRSLYSFTKIDRESLDASEIIADIDGGAANANTNIYVDANMNIYMTMTDSYISKIKLDYFRSSDIRSIISGLFPQN